jgi:hypothetical protein
MNPIRDAKGFCIECAPGEKGMHNSTQLHLSLRIESIQFSFVSGLMIGLIGNTTKTAYPGYANNEKASKKKIIDDVFKKSQKAFDSGILRLYMMHLTY